MARQQEFEPRAWLSTWGVMASPRENPMGVGWLGMAMGLGFVLSFGS